jgi:hypothetical protein
MQLASENSMPYEAGFGALYRIRISRGRIGGRSYPPKIRYLPEEVL